MLSVTEAAKETGKTRQAISKALRNGKISGTKNANGDWEIDPAELFRVYKRVESNTDNQPTTSTTRISNTLRHELELLRQEMATKEAELKGKDAVIDAKEEMIKELRSDKEQLTALLTDQREKTKQTLWQRIFGTGS